MTDPAHRSVLVTGGAGFIGSHLVEDLVRRGAQVTVVDNISRGFLANLAGVADRIDFRLIDLQQDDLRSLMADGAFETIYHLSGNAYVPTSVEDPMDDFEKNVLATMNLLEAVRECSPETRVLYTSTAAVYGEGASRMLREEDPTVPTSPYGVSKLAAERYVAVYAQVYHLRTASVRLFSVYGPRLRKQVVYDLMRRARENPNELFIYGDGTQVRDFNHVANVVQALHVVAEKAALHGEVYNVAGEEAVCIRDVARMICERLEITPSFLYSGQVRPGETQQWRADTTRLRSLGYEPRMRLDEGLSDTVAWFRREECTVEKAHGAS